MTWFKAREYCQSEHTELASVRDATENDRVFAVIQSDAWIGLHRTPWSYWSDGSRAAYFNWATGQPNNYRGKQHCVAMHFNEASYDDFNCEDLRYVACQERQNQRSTFKLKISSEADMTNPDVQRQFLKQVGRFLR